MRTLRNSLLIDDTIHNVTNHSNVCVCNFSMIIGCDFNFSVLITTHDDLPFDYMLYHKLQPTPIGINLTVINWLLYHPDLINHLQKAWEMGQRILITVHHNAEEIHRVLERVKKGGRHQWWEVLCGLSPTSTGTLNLMLHPNTILLISIMLCLLLTIIFYVRVWRMSREITLLQQPPRVYNMA